MSVRRDQRNNRWYFRIRIDLPSGKKVRLFGTPEVNTRKSAEHAERVAIEEALNPSAARLRRKSHEDVPTVKEYSKIFMAGNAAKHKPSTVKSKQQILKAHVLPILGHLRLDEIRQVDVDGFQSDLLEFRVRVRGKDGKLKTQKRTRSRKTVNNILSVLSSLLRYAHRNGEIESMGLSFFLKSQAPELRAVSQQEITELLEVTSDQRYRVAILLACDAGMRVGELRAVRWGDLNEINRSICIAQAFDPSGNLGSPKSWKSRTVPMSDRLREEIGKLDRIGEMLITRKDGNPISYWAVNERIHALYEAAAIVKPPKVWHCLRHSFCTLLAGSGTPVHIIKELAGHASIETTLRYMHTSEEAKQSAIANAFGRTSSNRKGSHRAAARTEKVKSPLTD